MADTTVVAAPRTGGYLNYPANGPITSEFGMRFHPILHYWKLHTGTDFGIACGTPVYATANGTIIGAGWNTAYGNRFSSTTASSTASTW